MYVFSQSHAVRQHASAPLDQAVDDAENGVLLKEMQLIPDVGFGQPEVVPALYPLFQLLPEQVVEREEIDKLGGLILAESLERRQHFLLGALAPFAAPQFVKPFLQFGAKVFVGDDVQFAVCRAPNPSPRQVKLELPQTAAEGPSGCRR